MSNDYKYLDVMTVRAGTSNPASSARHQSLLVEPVLLPDDLSHLNLDKPTDNREGGTSFFYPTGKMSVNITQQVAQATEEKMKEAAEKLKRKSCLNAKKKQSKKPATNSLSEVSALGGSSSTVKSRPKLYYGRKPDIKTENLLNSLRYNEAKIVGIISTTT